MKTIAQNTAHISWINETERTRKCPPRIEIAPVTVLIEITLDFQFIHCGRLLFEIVPSTSGYEMVDLLLSNDQI